MNLRLEEIYKRIPQGKGVIDVGTDHGYIPAALAEAGYTGRIIASDINSGPLNTARRTAHEAGVEDRIEFMLSDGLTGCPYKDIDTVVIAGMGGDLICRILDRAEWTMNRDYTFILQPMTKAEVLRYWLTNNEYDIIEEVLVNDGTVYQILVVRFGQFSRLSDAELFVGEFELIKNSPLAAEHTETLIKRFKAALSGMTAGDKALNFGRIRLYRGILKGLEEMRDRF